MAATSSGTASGSTPDLLSSSEVFTCISTFKGPFSVGRCSLSRRATLSRSRLWTQSLTSAISAVFVALYWANKVPAQGQVGECSGFFSHFLCVIFTKCRKTQPMGLPNDFRRLGFTHR